MAEPSYRALIVDDEWTVRQLTRNALSRIGIDCHFAANGCQALESLKKSNYDVVITDLMMPDRNGHQLCLDLLARPDRPLIMVLTGVVDAKIATDLLKRGVDDVAFKPVDYYEFMAKVRTLLASREESPAAS
ncbi:MAG: response regulator [Planctomycetaceae bacterium]